VRKQDSPKFSPQVQPVGRSVGSNSEWQFLCCCHRGTDIPRVHPVHLMNLAQPTANL